MTREYSQKQFESIGREELKKAKNDFKAIVMDQDGTVKGGDDPAYTKSDVLKLLKKIIRRGKYPAIITGSGASALKYFSSMNDFYTQENLSIPTYIGIGNGVDLYRFDAYGRNENYNHGLTLDEEKAIIRVWQDTYETMGIKVSDLQPNGIEIFKKFMAGDWTGYIPSKYIDLSKQYAGLCFCEPIKVTVVFPVWKAERQRDLVKIIKIGLDKKFGVNKYSVTRGDETFIHITRSLKIDSKLFALHTIMKVLDFKRKDIIVFGDLPLDNDRGLLVESKLPYTFTNHIFSKYSSNTPPYILPGSLVSPIGCVYKAIEYLLQ
jgi:hydroxymethylpyrimidine pyrophosphatase-like HAD family hydrolase